jgi:hypothetical protein
MVILDLIRVMGGLANGALAEVTIRSAAEHELADRWCARTGNTIVRADIDVSGGGTLVVHRGRLPDPAVDLGRDRMPGARLWLYTNFHCNLACDYCCVASSPQAPRRELGAERIARLVNEAAAWGVRELYLTGGSRSCSPTSIPSCAPV